MGKDAKEINKEQEHVIDQTTKIHIADMGIIQAGIALGHVFAEAGKTQKTEVLKCAAMLVNHNDEDVNDFLKGFREGLDSSSAPAQASKVKAVIMAYRVPEFTYFTGEKGEDGKIKLDENGAPLQTTKSGKEWLEGKQTGTFEEFVSFARKVRGLTEGQGSGGGRTKKALTDKDMERAENTLKLANKDQAAEIIARATDQLQTVAPGKAWEPLVVEQIDGLVHRLAKSDDFVWQKLAETLQGTLNDHYAIRGQMATFEPKEEGKLPPMGVGFEGPKVPEAAQAAHG